MGTERDFVPAGQVIPAVFDQTAKRLRVLPDEQSLSVVSTSEEILLELKRIRIGLGLLIGQDLEQI